MYLSIINCSGELLYSDYPSMKELTEETNTYELPVNVDWTPEHCQC